MLRGEKGITLVALVITIIVLIILAAVSIISVQNLSIVGRAVNASQDYENSQQYEKKTVDNISTMLESVISNISKTQTGGTTEP